MNKFRIRFGCSADDIQATREVSANDAAAAISYVIDNAPILERYPYWEARLI